MPQHCPFFTWKNFVWMSYGATALALASEFGELDERDDLLAKSVRGRKDPLVVRVP